MRRGFTLTEILVAVIILGICILGILPLIAVASRAHRTAAENADASAIARASVAGLQEILENSNPAYQRILSEIKKSTRIPKTAVIPLAVPAGFPGGFRVRAEISELAGQDPSQSGFVAVVRVRWLADGYPDLPADPSDPSRPNNEDVGRVWYFRTVLMKKSDHRDIAEAEVARAPTPPPSRPRSYDPVVEWAGDSAVNIANPDLARPTEIDLMKQVMEAMGGKPRPWTGKWETAFHRKTEKGVCLFQKLDLKEIKDPNGKSMYGISGLMTFHPLAASGLHQPRLLQIAKRDVWVDDKPSDLNGHPLMVEGAKSPTEPFLKNQQVLAKPEDPDAQDLGESGVMGWSAPGISSPWVSAKNYSLRIAWTLYTWVVCKNAEGADVPIGYFSWRVVLDGKVGIGPMDTELKPRLEVVAFIEADGKSGQGGDHVLDKALKSNR